MWQNAQVHIIRTFDRDGKLDIFPNNKSIESVRLNSLQTFELELHRLLDGKLFKGGFLQRVQLKVKAAKFRADLGAFVRNLPAKDLQRIPAERGDT